MPDGTATASWMCTCQTTGGPASCRVHTHYGTWPSPNVPCADSDNLARAACMAAIKWLASDGNDDAYAVFTTAVAAWEQAVLDGR